MIWWGRNYSYSHCANGNGLERFSNLSKVTQLGSSGFKFRQSDSRSRIFSTVLLCYFTEGSKKVHWSRGPVYLYARSQHVEFCLWQRSWGRGLIGKGEIRPQGNPPGPSWASTPKPEFVCLIILWLSPTFLTLTGAIPNHLSLEKVNLELQLTVSCI